MTRFPISPVLLVPLLVIVALLAALLLTGRVPLSYNVRNLLVRWRMTLLTAMAFALVVGLLVVMQAFINGMLKLTDEKNEDLTFQLAENGKVTANDLDGKLENLRPEDLVWIAYEERGKERIALEVHGSSRRRFVQIRGVEDPLIAAEVHRLQLLPG